MSNTSVIIINYNTNKILNDCLANLEILNETREIIVVDNNSKDGSADMVREKFPKVKLFALPDNKGLSYASNIGLKNATGKYLLYLGSDAFPSKGCISGIEKYMNEHEDVGASTAKLVLRDGSIDMDAHRGFPTPYTSLAHFSGLDRIFKGNRIFDKYFLGYENLDAEHEIDMCISHFLFVKKSVIEKIGLWDEDYFVFGEDVDICYRIKSAGYKIMYLPQFVSGHYKGASVGIRKQSQDISTASVETKIKMMRMKATGMEIFYKKHYQNKYPQILNYTVLFGIKALNSLRMMKIKVSQAIRI